MEPNQAQSGLIFSVIDRYKQDDRNTGCIHTIISFGICIGTPRVKKQSSIIVKKKHKSHKQLNHKKTNIFNRK